MPGFLAYVLPVGGDHVSHPIHPGGPSPTPPIYYPGGGGGGGGGGSVSPPIYYPPEIWPQPPGGGGGGQPPYPSQGPGFPTHPIAPGGQPPGIWGGGNVPMPTPPIYIPIVPPSTGEGGEPSHPIYIPVYPSQLPTLPPQLSNAIREALKNFATGNLPPAPQPVQ